jgi:L-amino acid N-acyltransferase YncA
MEIVPLHETHWPAVRHIYEAGIATRNATFEEGAPDWETWNTAHLDEHRFVAIDGDDLLGWVAASPVSDRCCYSGVIEHSVYVDPDHQGEGVARALLTHFVASTEAAGIWTIQSGVFPENLASLAVHARVGFRVVGIRSRIGKLDGIWRDVVAIERRSALID